MKKLVALVLVFVVLTLAGPTHAADGVPPALIGEWELTLKVDDLNRNGKLDDEERRKAVTQVKDYYKFNSDGTCLFYTFKNKGRFEVKTRTNDGKQLVTVEVLDKDNRRVMRGTIVSLTDTELVLVSYSIGTIFSAYKRL